MYAELGGFLRLWDVRGEVSVVVFEDVESEDGMEKEEELDVDVDREFPELDE